MSKINKANPHTVKKFELVESYVKTWAQTLLNAKKDDKLLCRELVFIDCMCNSGVYEDADGKTVEGTPIRVAKIIADIMPGHPNQKATLYFNDSDSEKIAKLKQRLPAGTDNFKIELSFGDGNDFLKKLWSSLLSHRSELHYLLFYDPYEAAIDWEALSPYFLGWGEFILNHMVSDSIRALKSAKRPEAKRKYNRTYLTPFDELSESVGDRKEYEQRLKNIIAELCRKSNLKYYVATVPFFITTNALIYDLVFFTKNIAGFRKFKAAAWKTFGGKSSNKRAHEDKQISFFDTSPKDNDCYFISDIADYIVDNFKDRKDVPLQEIWDFVDEHPIFPTDGYKPEIKRALKFTGRCQLKRSTADFV